MKHRIFCICFLILLFSVNSFSQRKALPLWLNQIEEAIQRDSQNPRISIQYNSDNNADSYRYVIFVELTGGQFATIQIEKGKFDNNSKENFKTKVEALNTSKIAKDISSTELKNIGDEAHIWGNIGGASSIMFRKDDIFVSIVINQIKGKKTSEISFEDWAKRLAQYLDTYLPII